MRVCTWRRFSFFDVFVSMVFLSLVVILVRALLRTHDSRLLFRSGLSDLLLQTFASVADALVLVGIGWPKAAHFCGDLSHLLPIDSIQGQLRLFGINRRFDASGQRIFDRVGVSQREYDRILALKFSAI